MTPSSAGRRPVEVFVADAGNAFMTDIAAWVADASRSSGRMTSIVSDRLPGDDDVTHLVIAPHEFFELFDASAAELQAAATRSVCISTEQPGTPWFELTVDVCRRARRCLDINHHGVAALRERGITASHLQLGAVASMSATTDPLGADRPLDVVFMGGLDDRRSAELARLAPQLAKWRTDIRVFPFDRPVSTSAAGLVFGRDKYELLSTAKLLVNLHRDRPDNNEERGHSHPHYFEWARMVESMANGCVVVSEPAEQYEPLVAGTHFVSVEIEDMGAEIDRLLGDHRRRAAIARAALDAVTGPLALGPTMTTVLEELDAVANSGHHEAVAPSGRWGLGRSKIAPPVRLAAFKPQAANQRAAKRVALADTALIRRVDRTLCAIRHGSDQFTDRITTPAYRRSTPPRVSAIVTLYNYERVVGEALASLAASESVDFEIIVVDDHSTDEGRAVVEEFLLAHADVAALLLAKECNEGLATARNDAFAEARGEYVFVIDADNQVYPSCLARLAETLDAEQSAAAAYAILEDFGTSSGIRSAFSWDPERLCRANYIDAQAMWRRSAWYDLGGYRNDDDHVYGWEDWDLWLRLASRGGHATLHREILGRYRVQESSMIALTNLDTDDAIMAMRHRYPRLPWPASPTPPTRSASQMEDAVECSNA